MRILILVIAFAATISCKQKEEITDTVKCYTETKSDSNLPSDIIIKTCEFKNHLFRATGIADYKGRYSYDYEILRIRQADTIVVKNTEFFNQNTKKLEQLINEKLKTKHELDSKIPEIEECMNWIDFRYYKLDEFGITFPNENRIEFNIDYNIGSACFNVKNSSVIIDISDIGIYLQ